MRTSLPPLRWNVGAGPAGADVCPTSSRNWPQTCINALQSPACIACCIPITIPSIGFSPPCPGAAGSAGAGPPCWNFLIFIIIAYKMKQLFFFYIFRRTVVLPFYHTKNISSELLAILLIFLFRAVSPSSAQLGFPYQHFCLMP